MRDWPIAVFLLTRANTTLKDARVAFICGRDDIEHMKLLFK
jgi:hypothetical protein